MTDPTVLGMTHSTCPTCGELVPARVEERRGCVHFRKLCAEHGESSALVWSDVESYLAHQRVVKPAWVPRAHAGDDASPCPDGCGSCSRHEQHLCMPIVEITSRCDMACPVCLVDAGGRGRDMSLDDFGAVLDRLIAAEGQIDVLNLSGGEPTIHPRFMDIVDAAVGRPEIVRVSVSTNGTRLLDDRALLRDLKARDVVVSLQFDGTSDDIYKALRGRPLADEKTRALEALADTDITTSLTMTAARGVNDGEFGAVLDVLFSRPNVVSLMVQPVSFAGRARSMDAGAMRMTIPDVLDALGRAGNAFVSADDFAPLPCSHPLCFALSYYLIHDSGEATALSRIAPVSTMLDTIANRTVFGLDAGEQERLRELVYELWSGPAAALPEGEAVLSTVRRLLRDLSCPCSRFDPRRTFTVAERHLKSIFIHAFQDGDTFDLARARRCCNGYPQPDGRIVPACVMNCLGRRP
ncbi:MAG: radical SAM protein [Planctomycetota bacterium]|jgi:uncharacterized radical SAM superfamily Fe-S cluster-containing enzyme